MCCGCFFSLVLAGCGGAVPTLSASATAATSETTVSSTSSKGSSSSSPSSSPSPSASTRTSASTSTSASTRASTGTSMTTVARTTGVTSGQATTSDDATSSGTASESSGTASESSAGTTAGHIVQCTAPRECQPYFFDDGEGNVSDIESGWLYCQGGFGTYRQAPVACAQQVFWPACQGDKGTCAVDADCEGSESCVDSYGYCKCVPQCMSDSDCGDDELCLCAAATVGHFWISDRNICIKADCRGSDDCADECGCHASQNFCTTFDSAYCHTKIDTCADNGDCWNVGGGCSWSDEQWSCIEWGNCE